MCRTSPDPAILLQRPPGPAVLAADPPASSHLVGGAIRDWLLGGRVSHDWDLVVDGGGGAFAGRLAERIGGRSIEAGGARFSIFRVVGSEFRIDVWDREGESLDDELARRDFTINSIALDLADCTLYDPLGGRRDLAARLLRSNREEAFGDDPLRILRLLRFELTLDGFRATPATLEAARRSAPDLPRVTPERVREELDRVLSRRPAHRLGRRLRDLDLHPRLWSGDEGRPEKAASGSDSPPSDPLELAALEEWLQRVERAAGRIAAPEETLALRHAALLLRAPTGPEATSSSRLLSRGWVTRREARHIDHLLERRDRPRSAAEERLFLHRAGGTWPIVAACDAWRAPDLERAEWEPLIARLADRAEHEAEELFDPPPLLRGDEIARALGIEPGPELGRVVERLRRLQITRQIRTAAAARDWLAGEDLSSLRE